MSISMASFASPHASFSSKPQFPHKPTSSFPPGKPSRFFPAPKSVAENAAGVSATVGDPKPQQKAPELSGTAEDSGVSNGAATAAVAAAGAGVGDVPKFQDPKWVGGTWNLKQFQKNGKTDWDAVIDDEARRRKWLESNPESTSNDDLVVFNTSVIPWWAWIKRYHLPEAELLNGRAAMIGFFMAYFVDSLTGVGLVDQMSNFFCKTLLFVAVVGVLLIRKNEDIENLKKLLEETTFYDKQWQATWQDDTSSDSKND